MSLLHIWKRLNLCANIINLKERNDRRKTVIDVVTKIGLPYKLYLTDRHKLSGVQGCFESHQALCREALKNNEKQIFILEDDIIPTSHLFTSQGQNALVEAIDFLQSNSTWKIIYLGVVPNVWLHTSERVGKYVYKLNPYAQTHAMILNEEYMKEIVSWTFDGTPYDHMHRSCDSAYAIHPQIFIQSNSNSDLSIERNQLNVPNSRINILISLCSWYALHIGENVALFFLVFSIIVLICVNKKTKQIIS